MTPYDPTKDTIGITGASGFLGRALVAGLSHRRINHRALVRSIKGCTEDAIAIGDLDGSEVDPAVLVGCRVVIHTAGISQVDEDEAKDELATFRRVNLDGSLAIARAAVQAGCSRLVFISSIKACKVTPSEKNGNPSSSTIPDEPYGLSKREAEDALLDLCAKEDLELCILRPPLIHGPGVKGNLYALCRAIASRKPLPLARTHNRRSLLGIDNAVDAILQAATETLPASRPQGDDPPIWNLADTGTISIRRMVEAIADGMGIKPRLLPVPPFVLKLGGMFTGRRQQIVKLLSDLVVDSTKFQHDFRWRPKVGLEEGLRAMGSAWAATDGCSRSCAQHIHPS